MKSIVRLAEMTDAELDTLARQYERKAAEHRQHAEELLRYKAERTRPTSAA